MKGPRLLCALSHTSSHEEVSRSRQVLLLWWCSFSFLLGPRVGHVKNVSTVVTCFCSIRFSNKSLYVTAIVLQLNMYTLAKYVSNKYSLMSTPQCFLPATIRSHVTSGLTRTASLHQKRRICIVHVVPHQASPFDLVVTWGQCDEETRQP